MRTIHGTKHNDVIPGSGRPSEVFGDKGNDWLGDIGREGLKATDDIYHGGNGDDFIFTFGGKDRVYGDSGNDTLSASTTAHDVYFDGGRGNDFLVVFSGTADYSAVYDHSHHLVQLTVGDTVFHLTSVEDFDVVTGQNHANLDV